jgi:predicted ABC-type ATPase
LLENQISFTYETVMSHRSKLDFLKKAKDSGYKIYLYYVATEDPRINVSRVNFRVIQHGHFVEPDLIEKRYYKSLKLLKEAIITSDRAFIWDNSSNASNLFAEIIDGRDVKILDIENVPNWFVEYL